MKTGTPLFEYILEVHDATLIRRSVRNMKTGKVEVDDTQYVMLTDVTSFNRDALKFKKLKADARPLAPVIRAIGRPGTDAVEIIFIGPDWVQSVKTVKDYMVIQRFERTQ